ncbi:unnamed protein product [Protopolystoma xenopodis]|uniref:Uncharacterized protein n=1 Tax=Protopolystoma xenopodis TaxID=117903 RepID=A0A3S5ADS9_9PLAT|nr:unnamed protein product [Protopolystoma xenopodis]
MTRKPGKVVVIPSTRAIWPGNGGYITQYDDDTTSNILMEARLFISNTAPPHHASAPLVGLEP